MTSKINVGKTMPPWNSTCTTSARLSKAKSSPNVSKTTSCKQSPLKTVETRQKNLKSVVSVKTSGNTSVLNPTDIEVSKRPSPIVRKPIKNKVSSDDKDKRKSLIGSSPLREQTRSPSCTILEDRVLLKKGLPVSSTKMVKRPEKSLNRSTSLWSVQSNQSPSAKRLELNSPQQRKSTLQTRSKPQQLSRASSLWSVPKASTTAASQVPSRIPLSTQHRLLQSLGDLSVADRIDEPTKLTTTSIDEVDRSVDEHIYENCREASRKLDDDVDDEQLDDKNAKVVPLTTLELEKRAEQLLSQLDEDEAVVEASIKQCAQKIHLIACKINSDETSEDPLLTCVANNALNEKRAFAKSQDGLQLLHCSRRRNDRNEANNVQEIRRNWIERCSNQLGKSDSSSLVDLTNKANNNNKSAKLEHLVNFFNCKNAQEMESTQVKPSISKKTTTDKGYASDGNSSEDSGHISNEAEEEVQIVASPPTKINSSSASSVDSRDNSPKLAKKQLLLIPQPSRRHSLGPAPPTQQV